VKARGGPAAQALPCLAHSAQPLGPAEQTISGMAPAQSGGKSPGEDGPAIVYRSPAPAAARAPKAQEGEAVLAAQTVGPDRMKSANRAFSYPDPGGGWGAGAKPAGPAGQEGRMLGQAAGSINYDRLTEEILVRIERRLRAERRKFGL